MVVAMTGLGRSKELAHADIILVVPAHRRNIELRSSLLYSTTTEPVSRFCSTSRRTQKSPGRRVMLPCRNQYGSMRDCPTRQCRCRAISGTASIVTQPFGFALTQDGTAMHCAARHGQSGDAVLSMLVAAGAAVDPAHDFGRKVSMH